MITNYLSFKLLLVLCVSVLSVAPVAEGTTLASFDFTTPVSGSFTAVNNAGAGIVIESSGGNGVMTGGDAAEFENLTDYVWNGVTRNASQSWSYTVEATVTDAAESLGVSNDVTFAIGLSVANASDLTGDNVFVELGNENTFGRYYGSFWMLNGVESDPPESYTGSETLTLQVSYDAATHVISAAINGSTLQSHNVVTDWGMATTDEFAFGISGYIDEGAVPTDQDYLWLDNLQLDAVPEPSSVMMLGVAALGLCVRRKR